MRKFLGACILCLFSSSLFPTTYYIDLGLGLGLGLETKKGTQILRMLI